MLADADILRCHREDVPDALDTTETLRIGQEAVAVSVAAARADGPELAVPLSNA